MVQYGSTNMLNFLTSVEDLAAGRGRWTSVRWSRRIEAPAGEPSGDPPRAVFER